MKRNLYLTLILALLAVLGFQASAASIQTVTMNCSEMGWENGKKVTSFTISQDGIDMVEVTVDKNQGQTAPSYYSSNGTLRLYSQNSITFRSIAGYYVTGIEFETLDNGKFQSTFGCSTGAFTADNVWKTSDWKNTEVTLTNDGERGEDNKLPQVLITGIRLSIATDYPPVLDEPLRLTMSEMGWTNETEVHDFAFSLDGENLVTVEMKKNGGDYNPRYYTTTNTLRVYKDNQMVFTAAPGYYLNTIEFQTADGGTFKKEFGHSTGTIYKENTWSYVALNQTSVTLENNGERGADGKYPQVLITGIKVTLSTKQMRAENGLVFEVTGKGKVRAIANPALYFDGDYTMPTTVSDGTETYNVVGIAPGAFRDCRDIASMVLPDGVTYIPDGAFERCLNMKSITLGNNVTGIGEKAFSECGSLRAITMPATMKEIAPYAFYQCVMMREVTLNDGLETIGENAFYSCCAIEDITIPNSVKNLGKSAFALCTNLRSFSLPEGFTTVPAGLIGNCWGITRVELPSTITSIEHGAFGTLKSLSMMIVKMPDPSAVTCNVYSFDYTDCGKATLVVPVGKEDSYKAIDYPWGQFGLITSELDNFVVGNYLYNLAGEKTVTLVRPVNPDAMMYEEVPETVDYNGDTYTVVAIADEAFAQCKYLRTLSLPSTLTYIGSRQFTNCGDFFTGMVCMVEDPATITMGQDVFSGLNLASAKLMVPNNSVNAYKNALQWKEFGNILQADFEYEGMKYQFKSFGAYLAECWLVGPVDKDAFNQQVALNGGEYHVSATVKNGDMDCEVKTIGGTAFASCTELKSIYFPYTVEAVGTGAMAGCDKLETVVFESSAVNFAGHIFHDCNNIKAIKLMGTDPMNYKVRYGAFDDSSVENMKAMLFVPEGTVEAFSSSPIGFYFRYKYEYQFTDEAGLRYDMTTLTDDPELATASLIGSPYGITEMNVPARTNANGIDSRVTAIGKYAFAQKGTISALNFAEDSNIETIGAGAFMACHGLTELVLPKGLTLIDVSAFYGCDLKNINIPESVNVIAADAFGSNNNLEWVKVDNDNPANISLSESPIFTYIDLSNATLKVPQQSIELYKVAPQWKEFGKVVGFECSGVPFTFDDGNNGNDVWYNLQGIKVNSDRLLPGIYIRSGKKVIIK